MVQKVYKKLSEDQKNRSVIFSSCLSPYRFETKDATIHEVFSFDVEKHEKIERLKDDKFFNKSHFKFNIIRQ
jgi:hypothetical protein